MHREKEKNLAMITIAAVILVATNMGVWLAAQEGAIAPVDNSVLWIAFVALNVASILWAIVLLGLQPMVVSLSYVAGGFLAYKGVQGMGGISVAEVTSAGATYGAFGALAVGNVTTKVRLAFYNRKQIPFIYIIAGLLILDAVLNSGISSARGSVILNAVVFPFMLAGVVVGLIWAVLNHFGIGHNPPKTIEATETAIEKKVEKKVERVEKPAGDGALKIEVPEHIEQEPVPDAISETVVEPEVPPAPSVKEAMAPAAEATAEEEEFFPLEIDNDDAFVVPVEETELRSSLDDEESDLDESYSISSFDSGLYASGALDDHHGGVMVEEPLRSVSLDLHEAAAPVAAPAVSPVSDSTPVVPEEVKPEEQAPEANVEPKNKEKSGDWLSGHLDLLNKLK